MKIIEETTVYRRIEFPSGGTQKLYKKHCSKCNEIIFVRLKLLDRETQCRKCYEKHKPIKNPASRYTDEVRKRISDGVRQSYKREEERSNGIVKSRNSTDFVPYTKDYGVASFNYLYRKYESNAKTRGLAFDITKEEFRVLTQLNCFYCNKSPESVAQRRNANGCYRYNGLDRLDSSKGYVLDNIVPCCKDCNIAKRDIDVVDFLAMIERIHSFQEKEKILKNLLDRKPSL